MEEEQKQNSVAEEASEDFGLPSPKSDETTIEITREDFVHFIGDDADKYLTKFRKFYADGRDKFAFTWHWPAFFFTFIWMAYRKLYGWALALFLLNFIPFLGFFFWVIFGLTGNYLYYKYTKKKILNLKTTQTFSDSNQMVVALRKIGGVNVGAMGLAIAAAVSLQIFQLILKSKL